MSPFDYATRRGWIVTAALIEPGQKYLPIEAEAADLRGTLYLLQSMRFHEPKSFSTFVERVEVAEHN
jgi:hypothetical protein